MNTSLKTTFAAALIMSATVAHAAGNERLCLISGRLAESITEVRDEGTSEDRILVVMGPRTSQHTKNIVAYIYSNSHNSKDNRELVYLKCKAGEFD